MLTAGESPIWRVYQMGHRGPTMIGRTYGRWMTNAVSEAGMKAVALFGGDAAKNL
jgi:integrase